MNRNPSARKYDGERAPYDSILSGSLLIRENALVTIAINEGGQSSMGGVTKQVGKGEYQQHIESKSEVEAKTDSDIKLLCTLYAGSLDAMSLADRSMNVVHYLNSMRAPRHCLEHVSKDRYLTGHIIHMYIMDHLYSKAFSINLIIGAIQLYFIGMPFD